MMLESKVQTTTKVARLQISNRVLDELLRLRPDVRVCEAYTTPESRMQDHIIFVLRGDGLPAYCKTPEGGAPPQVSPQEVQGVMAVDANRVCDVLAWVRARITTLEHIAADKYDKATWKALRHALDPDSNPKLKSLRRGS